MNTHQWRPGRRARQAVASVACLAVTGLVVTTTTGTPASAYESDFEIDRHDLEFILKQIQISESHASGNDLLCDDRADMSWTCVPDPKLPYGLRTVDGSDNNLFPGRAQYGAAGQTFPRLLEARFRNAQPLPFDPDGPGPANAGDATTYASNRGFVIDAQPREISNLIVDQTAANPAAVESMGDVVDPSLVDHDNDPSTPDLVVLPDVATDEGLSAPFNSWFTLFGQFFDHGLDLVSKGGSGTVMIPLDEDDPLYRPDAPGGAHENAIYLTRATNQPGPDGVLGTTDDVKEHTNRTTPFVDQNQTYTSHPSHQLFIREYAVADGETTPVPTGKLLNGPDENADGTPDGLARWVDVKAQAADLLGVALSDLNAVKVPLMVTDPYGRFVPGDNGFPQVVFAPGAEPATATCETVGSVVTCEGDPANPVDAAQAMSAGHAFLDDISHPAAPTSTPDADTTVGDPLATPAAGEYDDELLGAHYVTGDGRGNENIGLTAVHHVFHSEHNRLVGHIQEVLEAQDEEFQARWHDESGPWDFGERLFQASRYVTEMEYQHLVFEEFARKIQPSIDAGPLNESLYHADINPAVTAEFAHVVYRFGHSMLTETVDREGAESMSLLDAFLNPRAFTDDGAMTSDQGAASVIEGMMNQTGNGIDEFVTPTLRNELLGLPLDLASINLARARDAGVPGLQEARRTFYANGLNSALKPYANWAEFRLEMKHRSSIVNFIAAYGTEPDGLVAGTPVQDLDDLAAKRDRALLLSTTPAFMNLPAAQSGLNDVDFWIGGLAERPAVFGGMLGTTFNVVFEEHLENLQNADRFYYLNRNQGLNLFHQLEANSFAELVMRNTDAVNVPGDMFASQDLTIDLAALPDPLPAEFENLVQLDGWWRWDGEEHLTIHGTDGPDRIRTGDGDDALWGHGGDDDLEGGVGNDSVHAGSGDDIIADVFGDDTIHGGAGDDAINAGHGLDILFGQSGSDFLLHGQEITQSFAGQGRDYVLGGKAGDLLTGNEADDWLEGGEGADLVQGDNALTFQNDPVGGADVLDGGKGNDDHDAEGGDDVMLNNGRDRHAGMLGFDWVTHKGDPDPVDADLDVIIFQPPNVTTMRSRFMNVEGLSGWDGNDVLRGRNHPGDQAFPTTGDGHELTQAGIDRIDGLRELLGGGAVPQYATPFLATNQMNNIILGGSGSDLIEGRGGDDFIDGDRALDVYLEYTEEGVAGVQRAEGMAEIQERVFARQILPRNISIKRAVFDADEPEGVIDTAYYEDVRANHTVTRIDATTWRVAHVDEDAGGLSSGVDILKNIERLQFADAMVDLADGPGNDGPSGTIQLSSLEPVEDQEISVVGNTITDPDGVGEITYTWQFGDDEGEWTSSASGTGETFIPGDAEATWPLRVVATYTDGNGTLETVVSQATLPVTPVADPATGLVVDDTTPMVGELVRATGLVDPDGFTNDDGDITVDFTYQWQRGTGGSFTNIPGATGEGYTVTADDIGSQLRVRLRYTDNQGFAEDITSPATDVVPATDAPGAPSVSASAAGSDSATVSWTPGSDGGADLLGFEVEVQGGGDTRTVTGIAGDQSSVVVDGLEPGTPYRFRVRAINVMGAGAWSDATPELSVGTVANSEATGEAAIVGPTGGALTLNTASIADADGLGAFSFQWERRADDATWSPIARRTADTLPANRTLGGATVRVVVSFTDQAGNAEEVVSAPQQLAATKPTMVRSIVVTPGKPGGAAQIRVAWTAPASDGGAPITEYRVTARRVVDGDVVSQKRRTVGDVRSMPMRVPAGDYLVVVRARNSAGFGGIGRTTTPVGAR